MKHSIHQKIQVLKIYIDELGSNKKQVTQPDWLKAILVQNGTIKQG